LTWFFVPILAETQPPSDLANHQDVHLVPISTFPINFAPPNVVLKALFLLIVPLLYALKFIQLCVSLSIALLFRVPHVDQILLQVRASLSHFLRCKSHWKQSFPPSMSIDFPRIPRIPPFPSSSLAQTPPAMPATMIVRLCCWMKGATFILDWHNLGHTLFRHKVVPSAFLQWMEFAFGQSADVHLCVSNAMKGYLEEKLHKTVHVLYDRPHDRFCEVSHNLCHRLLRQHQDLFHDALSQFRHSWKKIRVCFIPSHAYTHILDPFIHLLVELMCVTVEWGK
jgi:hypothetical protein